MRDGLGALGNLALLAGSVRVGSKAIAGVLPDVLASCGSMREAAEELFGALEGWPSVRLARDELRTFVTARIDELERDLEPFVHEPLRASERLDLDRLLGRISRELDAAYSLMDMLEVAAHEPKVVLNVPELLRRRLSDPPSGRRPQRLFTARIATRNEIGDGAIKPRALAAFVGAEAERLATDGGEPSLIVSCLGGELGLEITSEPEALRAIRPRASRALVSRIDSTLSYERFSYLLESGFRELCRMSTAQASPAAMSGSA